MKVVLFGRPGVPLNDVVRTLRTMQPSGMRVASTLDGLARRLSAEPADCAILCFSELQESDDALIQRIHDIVTECRIPAVVALGRPMAVDRESAPSLALFDVVIGEPHDTDGLQEAISLALAISPLGPEASGRPTSAAQEHEPVSAPSPVDPNDLSDIEVRSWDDSGPHDHVEPGTTATNERGTDPETAALLEAFLRDEEIEPASISREERAVTETGTKLEVRRWGPAEDDDASGREQGSEATGAEPKVDGVGPALPYEHPLLTNGDIGPMAAPRLLVGHHIKGSSGVLELEMGGIKRRLRLLDGEVGADGTRSLDATQRKKLLDSLSWRTGTYRFEASGKSRRNFQSLGSTLAVVHELIRDRLTLNEVSTQLTPYLEHYPIRTVRVALESASLKEMRDIAAFLDDLAEETLNQQLGRAGASIEAALKRLLFCQVAGLLAFSPEARPAPAPLSPTETTPEKTADKQVDGGPAVQASAAQDAVAPGPDGSKADANARVTAPRTPRPPPPEPEPDPSEEVVEELAVYAEDFSSKSPYEIFELEAGCGRLALRERYYQLVREHHPDTYGLARSPQVKPLAEMVFRLVQKAFNELRKLETTDEPREDAGPTPVGARQAEDTPLPAEAVTPVPRSSDRASRLAPSGDRVPAVSRPSGAQRGAPSFQDLPDELSSQEHPPEDPPTPTTPEPESESGPPADRSPQASSPAGDERVPSGGDGGNGRRSVDDTADRAADDEDGPAEPGDEADSEPSPGRNGEGRAVAHGGARGIPRSVRTTGQRRAVTWSGSAVRKLPPEQLPPEQHFRNGVHMLKAGAFDKALECFQHALDQKEGSPVYAAHSAWCRFRLGEVSAAETKEELLRLLEEPNGVEFASLFMGHVLSAEGDGREALGYYHRCLTENPRNIDALRRVRLYNLRKPKKKEGLLDRIFSKKPKK